MKMYSLLLLKLSTVALLGGSVGCQPTENNIQPDSRKGYLTGKVLDTQGKPLKGAQVIADNTWLYDSNLLGVTDAKGEYSIKLSPGVYNATAELRVPYNGQTYKVHLRPDVAEGFSHTEAVVRNFQWTLTGKHPDQPGLHYGGDVTINSVIGSALYDPENIVFTFTPVGPLIDGSTGKALQLRSGQPRTEFYGRLPDVPIGRYRITAVHQPTGARIKVRNGVNGAFSADGSATLDFYGETGPMPCTNCMFLEYSE